jgi:Protein of unknown function (DUF3533)
MRVERQVPVGRLWENRSVSADSGRAGPAGGSVGENRKLLLGGTVVLLVVFALVGSNVAANHAPKPHRVPIGLVGTPVVDRAVGNSLARRAPGAYQIHEYTSLPAARAAILHRQVYGAYRPRPTAVLLVATAASPPIATLLQQTFTAVANAQKRPLAIRDLAPLPSSDSRGGSAFSAVVSLIIAGILGSTVIYVFAGRRPPAFRLAASLLLAIGAGLITALVTNVIVKAFHGQFFGVWGVATLYVLALGLPIVAFQTLVGIGGTAIGAVMFLVIGNPASGGASSPELLPGFWRDLSQFLPPGAAVTALRDVVYFNGHGMTHAAIVLGVYAGLGAIVAFAAGTARARAKPIVAPRQPAEST